MSPVAIPAPTEPMMLGSFCSSAGSKEAGSKVLVTENIPKGKTITQSYTLDYIVKQNKINNSFVIAQICIKKNKDLLTLLIIRFKYIAKN